MTAFAEFLQKYNVTTCRLAKLAGLYPSQISEYRRDLHRPSKQSVRRIAFGLGLPLDSVLSQIPLRERTENHPKPPVYCPTCHRKLYKKLPNPIGCEDLQEAGKQLQAA
jgi:transcriptional regulator with XRE-family HTH domain